jgi:Leucine-rich repeat (LRR) protein
MTLEELNLVGTQVSDLDPLASVEIGTLWLRDTPMSDLAGLAGKSLVSLDVEGTSVRDLKPLAGMSSLRRLNIARTAVADLTPLSGLQLERLIFTPSKIERGLEAIRGMSSLNALGTQFEDASDTLPPDEFWQKLDAGQIRE